MPFFRAQGHLRRHGVAVTPVLAASSTSMVRRFTSPHLSTRAQPLVEAHVWVIPGDGRERLMDKCGDSVVLLPQDLCVLRVGADALDAEEERVLERPDIGVCGGSDLRPTCSPCFTRASTVDAGVKVAACSRKIDPPARFGDLIPELIPESCALAARTRRTSRHRSSRSSAWRIGR